MSEELIQSKCEWQNCDVKVYCKKLCKMHYERARKGYEMNKPPKRLHDDLAQITFRLQAHLHEYLVGRAALDGKSVYTLTSEIVESWVEEQKKPRRG